MQEKEINMQNKSKITKMKKSGSLKAKVTVAEIVITLSLEKQTQWKESKISQVSPWPSMWKQC